ncbi:MAG TPA: LysE family translocator [Actinomycetota bacterium]
MVVGPDSSILGAAIAFGAFAALLTITPGLDTALVVRMSLGNGARMGRLTALGICAGCLVWGVAGAVGVTAVLTASGRAYDVLRYAGAAYLVWLGARTLFVRSDPVDDGAPPSTRSPWDAFRTGLLTNLLNPKVGAFYVSALPQFIPDDAPVLPTSVLLAAIHALEGVVWLFFVAALVARLGAQLRRPVVRRRLEQATGVVLIALGLRLAIVKR